MSTIHKSTFTFLRSLKANNNREWFEKNKDQYKAAKDGSFTISKTFI